VFTIRIIHEHRHHLEGDTLLAIAAAFQAQVDRLAAFVASLEGGASAQSDEDTAKLTAALDAAGAPPAVPPTE
jgi:pyruvate carboxylase